MDVARKWADSFRFERLASCIKPLYLWVGDREASLGGWACSRFVVAENGDSAMARYINWLWITAQKSLYVPRFGFVRLACASAVAKPRMAGISRGGASSARRIGIQTESN